MNHDLRFNSDSVELGTLNLKLETFVSIGSNNCKA
jgi:hypothetical protein